LRILLDECLPRALKKTFSPEHHVWTVPEAGYAGLKNGQLLRAIDGKFDLLITSDTNLQHQQTLSRYSVAFLLLRARSNDIVDLLPVMKRALAVLDQVVSGQLLEVE
jgi:hypothetical protein